MLARCHAYTYFINVLYNYDNDRNADFNNVNDCDEMCFILFWGAVPYTCLLYLLLNVSDTTYMDKLQ